MSRKIITMNVITSPEGRGAVMSMHDGKPIFENSGALDYHCGSCQIAVLRGVNFTTAKRLVFQCQCGAYNVLPWET